MMNSIAEKEIDEEFNAQNLIEYVQQFTPEQRASCMIFNHLLSLKHIQVRHIQDGIITISQHFNETNCLILNDDRFPNGGK